MAYFHGGIPGLRRGDRILPPDATGTEHRLSAHAEELGAFGHATRTDVVYLATERQVARAYAAGYPDGALYQVQPDGEVEPDPDCLAPGVAWQCTGATVVAVIDPVVLLRTYTFARFLRMLDGSAA
ncbi:hypothetical protein [Actinacidiphila sp. ITFR-21]|uniref:hypothetical protein n=1 Tax=Actinacidiphila sp. ITFR-21 TaxID=3075199 RepID=UPI00288BD0AC|nr:hypothetical protein [Streptomyces sp. ITFR-21]WNI19140.1 hypothetical protein RLT57_28790 [Streptomyces sp. ITFR-21]